MLDNKTMATWRQPSIGGVCTFLILCLSFSVFIMSYFLINNFNITKNIDTYTKQVTQFAEHIKQLDEFSKQQQNNHFEYNLFKKKTAKPLSVKVIQQALYKWQKVSGIDYLGVSFGMEKIINNDPIVYEMPIRLEIHTLKDQNFYHFLHRIENDMIGITKIDGFSIKKNQNIDQQIINKVKNGEKIAIFTGWIDLSITYQHKYE
jgi:hypothetical protein